MRAANYLYVERAEGRHHVRADRRDMPLIGLLGVNPSVQFDARKFTWLGSSSSFANDAYVLVVRTEGAGALDRARRASPTARRWCSAAPAKARTDADVPKILRDAIGIRIKQVLGYTATPSIVLAVERGEVDGRMFDYS